MRVKHLFAIIACGCLILAYVHHQSSILDLQNELDEVHDMYERELKEENERYASLAKSFNIKEEELEEKQNEKRRLEITFTKDIQDEKEKSAELVGTCKKEMAGLVDEMDKCKQSSSEKSEEIDKIWKEKEAIWSEQQGLSDIIEHCEKKNADLAAKHEELLKEKDSILQAYQSVSADKNSLKEQVDELMQERANYDTEIQHLRDAYQKVKELVDGNAHIHENQSHDNIQDMHEETIHENQSHDNIQDMHEETDQEEHTQRNADDWFHNVAEEHSDQGGSTDADAQVQLSMDEDTNTSPKTGGNPSTDQDAGDHGETKAERFHFSRFSKR